MSEITWERDALLLKVHTIKQVLEKARSPRPMTDRKIAVCFFFVPYSLHARRHVLRVFLVEI
jgi:hypothetical protein